MSSSNRASADGTRAQIDFDGLTVRFPDRVRPAVLNVTEPIERGEVIAITGPSGCGKTTLARVLAGFIPSLVPAEVCGDVRVGGLSTMHADPARTATRVGLIQQDPDAQICTLRVRQEVAFGPENLCLPPAEIERRVDRALRIAGIEHLVERETPSLSGGEKQRLAIASILAMEPEILVLDEPTANLDPPGAKGIFDTLASLREREGRTLLVIEHRLAPLLPHGPRLWVMDGGRVVLRKTTRRHEDLVELGLRGRYESKAPHRTSGSPIGVSARSVRVSYGARRVLDGLSLSIHRGEILGVIGANGCGKTTLLRLLAGLERPEAGTIERPDGMRVGMVFQHPHQQIFERTVRRELEIDGRLDDAQCAGVLEEARLSGLADAAPFSLSLGEQRRLTVSTALRTEPDLLLLDEPFIGQDRHNVAWMIGRIIDARDRGAAIVLVSHDVPLLAGLCDRILYLGEEPVDGSPSAVFAGLREIGEAAFTPEYWEGGPS